jgi:hypothetical protein
MAADLIVPNHVQWLQALEPLGSFRGPVNSVAFVYDISNLRAPSRFYSIKGPWSYVGGSRWREGGDEDSNCGAPQAS